MHSPIPCHNPVTTYYLTRIYRKLWVSNLGRVTSRHHRVIHRRLTIGRCMQVSTLVRHSSRSSIQSCSCQVQSFQDLTFCFCFCETTSDREQSLICMRGCKTKPNKSNDRQRQNATLTTPYMQVNMGSRQSPEYSAPTQDLKWAFFNRTIYPNLFVANHAIPDR